MRIITFAVLCRFLLPLRLVLPLLCCLYKVVFIYQFINVCPFDYTAGAGYGKVRPVNR